MLSAIPPVPHDYPSDQAGSPPTSPRTSRTGRSCPAAPATCFRVILHAERLLALDADAAIGAVEQRDVGLLDALGKRESASTAKPWFMLVISTRPDVSPHPSPTRWTGWLAPRWPWCILVVFAPAASASIWWPRQMPKSGISLSSSALITGTAYSPVAAGSPGPLERNTPSGESARISGPAKSSPELPSPSRRL